MKATQISIRALALLLSGCAGSAFAQTEAPAADAGASGGLTDIIVTAQKRAESLQKTPISIMAMSADDIEKRGISDITDLRAIVPGLQITPHPNSATTARVFIRGVGNNDDQITVDPSVAVYLDGIYIARGQGLTSDIAEVERIEVLRGPQGSLYGRNATGGAINYITKAPELGVFSGKQTFDYGNYNAFSLRTNLNIPIGDKVAVQVAYLRSQKDGFVDNAGTGVARFGDQRRDAWRAAVEWKPTDAVELRYSYDRSVTHDTPAYIAAAPYYPRVVARPTQGSPAVRDLMPNDVLVQGHSLIASWQVSSDVTLKSLTGYRSLDNFTNQNYLAGAVGPFPLFVTTFDQHQHQWSEELQLVGSTADNQLEYVLGGYWFDEKAHSFDITVPTGSSTLDRTATVHNTAYAVYGQATWRPQFLAGLYLTGGLRWSRDQRQATLAETVIPAGGGAGIVLAPGQGDHSFSNVSPTVILGYNVNGDVNVYLKYAKGYKAGGYNLRASSIARFDEGFGPESLDSFEAGIKSSWLGNHLRANLAVFRSNYRDIQVNVQSDPTNPSITDILNAGRARIQGAEFELTAKPSSNLSFSLNYAYLDAKYQQILSSSGQDITSHYYFVEAPKNTVTASAEYYFPKTSIGTFSVNVDYYMQSRKYSSSNDPRYITGDYGLLNARLTLSEIPVGFGKWRLSAYAKNLTDTKYYIAYFNAGLAGAMFGDPRSYGLQLAIGF